MSANHEPPLPTGHNYSALHANQKAVSATASGPLNTKPKQKKSAKKQGQASSGMNGVGGHLQGPSMLTNGASSHFGQSAEQFSGVFRQNSDNLNSKTSNYYTVINQTLASQVASSMNNGSFLPNDMMHRRGEAATETTTTAGSKRKQNKNANGGVTKSMKTFTFGLFVVLATAGPRNSTDEETAWMDRERNCMCCRRLSEMDHGMRMLCLPPPQEDLDTIETNCDVDEELNDCIKRLEKSPNANVAAINDLKVIKEEQEEREAEHDHEYGGEEGISGAFNAISTFGAFATAVVLTAF